jgi:hypothetical protein
MSFFRHEESYRPMDNRNVPVPWRHLPGTCDGRVKPRKSLDQPHVDYQLG